MPFCDIRTRRAFTGFYELIQSDDPQLRAIQMCIRAWQRSGADESAVPLVRADIRRIMDGELVSR